MKRLLPAGGGLTRRQARKPIIQADAFGEA
jgi:hypothetical protein